jgi:hypothetical protein
MDGAGISVLRLGFSPEPQLGDPIVSTSSSGHPTGSFHWVLH